jgi:lipopolysaccharide/colanic/teichoic acid biosynthesis glycosyltransferase
LRGDMSLVGPRPERPEIIGAMRLDSLVSSYSERLTVKPGVTGLAQIQLLPDSDIESVRRKVACDLRYISDCGLWLDLRILVGTLLAALGVAPRLLRKVLALPSNVENAVAGKLGCP